MNAYEYELQGFTLKWEWHEKLKKPRNHEEIGTTLLHNMPVGKNAPPIALRLFVGYSSANAQKKKNDLKSRQ
jgi:hypothetical protein